MGTLWGLIHPSKLPEPKGFDDERKAYEAFHALYSEKVRLIGEFHEGWSSSPGSVSEKRFRRISELNAKLKRSLAVLAVDTKRDDQITKSYIYKSTVLGMKASMDDAASRKASVPAVRLCSVRINDCIKSILDLIVKQDLIAQKGSWKTLVDLNKHGEFSVLLYDESLKVKELRTTVVDLLRVARRDAAPQAEAQQGLKGVRFVKAQAGSGDLKRFYRGPYTRRFPDPSERESLSVLNMRMSQGVYHLIVAKIGADVIGGIVYALFPCGKAMAAVIYWTCVYENRVKAGLGTRLALLAAQDIRARSQFSLVPALGIFIEVNDPRKMSADELAHESMDPKERIRFWRKLGYHELFPGYVQLTNDPSAYVYYCTLYVHPLAGWTGGMRQDELYDALFSMQVHLNGYKRQDLERQGAIRPWDDMVRELRKRPFYGLV